MKGLTSVPKPYITKILIEDGLVRTGKSKSYEDIYTDTSTNLGSTSLDEKQKIRVTFNLAFKSIYPSSSPTASPCKNLSLNQVSKILNKNVLWYKFVTSKAELSEFLRSEDKTTAFLNVLGGNSKQADLNALPDTGPGNPLKIGNLGDYVYYEGAKPILNVPGAASMFYEYPPSATQNPSFLACVFAFFPMTGDGAELTADDASFATEIIFMGGAIPQTTTYFTIADAYSSPTGDEPIGTALAPGDSPTTTADFIKLKYGLPGELWCGPVHRHYVDGAVRYMPGRKHTAQPHPYLVLNTRPNTKVVDMRIFKKIKQMYSYNTFDFTSFLNSTAQTLYLGNNNAQNSLNGWLSAKQPVFSEANYSLRKVKTSLETGGKSEGKVNVWFAVDKLQLLKQTSTLSFVLEKFTAINTPAASYFVGRMSVLSVQISRINTLTGQSTILLTANNDSYADDKTMVNSLGNPTGKGHVFRKVTDLKIGETDPNIDFYEFRDGEIDALGYDKNTYTYEIAFKFKDPFVGYLKSKLGELDKIIKDVDALIQKGYSKVLSDSVNPYSDEGMAMYGIQGSTKSAQKMVNAYNSTTGRFSPLFIQKASGGKPFLPFDMSEKVPGVPVSMAQAFEMGSNTLSPNNLIYAFSVLNEGGGVEAMSAYDISIPAMMMATILFLRNAVDVTTTTPELLIQARDLLALLDDRMRKLLSLYSPAITTKTETSFTYEDFEKSQGNMHWRPSSGNDPSVISFSNVFKETLDLKSMENHFDFLAGFSPGSVDDQVIRSIQKPSYEAAVPRNARNLFKMPDAAPIASVQTNLEASYLPLSTADSLAFFNMGTKNKENLENSFIRKTYQSMRSHLYSYTTAKDIHISIPEILSFYGMRFEMNTQADIQKALAQPGDPLLAVAVGNLLWTDKTTTGPKPFQNEFYDDNFGASYTPVDTAPGGKNSVFGNDPSVAFTQNPFGSVQDPRYAWQGASAEKYPLEAARSLITLLLSDNLTNYRNLNLFDVQESPFFLGKKKILLDGQPGLDSLGFDIKNNAEPNPLVLNVLAQIASATMKGSLFAQENLSPDTFGKLFKASGALKLENYQLYILYLCLFGRIFYLKGFESGSTNEEKSPVAYKFTKQIGALNWAPLSNQILASLAPGQKIYCKAELLQDNRLIDKKFIKLFSEYGIFNKYFYMRGTIDGPIGTTLSGLETDTVIGTAAPSTAVTTALGAGSAAPSFTPPL